MREEAGTEMKENPAEYEIRLQEAKEMAKLVPFEFDEAEPELPAEAPTVSVKLPVMATREAFALWLELVEGLKSGEAGVGSALGTASAEAFACCSAVSYSAGCSTYRA